jgi:hypothetical protein
MVHSIFTTIVGRNASEFVDHLWMCRMSELLAISLRELVRRDIRDPFRR